MGAFFKFGFIEEIQDTEIQDTRYRNGSRRMGFYISCIFVSCIFVSCIFEYILPLFPPSVKFFGGIQKRFFVKVPKKRVTYCKKAINLV